MIKKDIQHVTSSIKSRQLDEGEFIETKVERILNNNEPITDGAPTIYMERSDGVKPEYNIRTDRFEVALDYTDKITKAKTASREEKAKAKSGETASTQGTEPGQNPAA